MSNRNQPLNRNVSNFLMATTLMKACVSLCENIVMDSAIALLPRWDNEGDEFKMCIDLVPPLGTGMHSMTNPIKIKVYVRSTDGEFSQRNPYCVVMSIHRHGYQESETVMLLNHNDYGKPYIDGRVIDTASKAAVTVIKNMTQQAVSPEVVKEVSSFWIDGDISLLGVRGIDRVLAIDHEDVSMARYQVRMNSGNVHTLHTPQDTPAPFTPGQYVFVNKADGSLVPTTAKHVH